MGNSEFLPRSIDYLGDLGAKLRDLQGYGTLANELIQNADDAPASWMSFDIRQDALVVDNDGVFSECGDLRAPECLWRDIDNDSHRCDFHRFRLIGSGDKRLQEGTTGAFGIGFISVYQLTDQPELISAGRHWTLREERSEVERIAVCQGCPNCVLSDLPGTRFIFPFARDEQSPLRRALRAEPVPENITARVLEELDRSLPVAMLFLKNLGEIEVRYGGQSRRTFERVVDDDKVIISQGGSSDDRLWHLLRGNFEEVAEGLRVQHPARIEANRSSEIVVALPVQGELSAGMLCACLPTEESTGLPFHINADFFPSNDRKHVILGDDYQSQWNREALLAAARTVARATPQLTIMLGAERFWDLASSLNLLAQNTTRDGRDGVWREFWGALQEALRNEAVVLTSSGAWTSADSGVALLLQREETDNIAVLEGLGIKLVAEALRPYQALLRSIGVPILDVETLCSALTRNGLDKPVCLDDLPLCLAPEARRVALWTEIATLLERQGSTPHARHADEERLRTASLAPSSDNSLQPCRDVYSADAATVQLFSSLGLDVPFLDHAAGAFARLNHLCSAFEAEDAVLVLEESDPDAIQQLWQEGHFSLPGLISWFENRRKQIMDDDDTRRRLSALNIYPSAGQLHSLPSLVLPGEFEDPLGLTSLVDVEALGGRRQFLFDLGATELDLRTYVLEHLSHAIEDETLDPAVRREAVSLLADRLGELIDDNQVRQTLSSIRFVICGDGEYRRPGDCYFESSIVQEVLGNGANIAVLPKEREASLQRLLDWLGVASVPRLRDIIRAVRRITDEPCSDTTVIRIQRIAAHLSGRFDDLREINELEELRSIEWLPARRDRNQWHAPSSLYAPYRYYLFESQGRILDVLSLNSDFLEYLGVHLEPDPALVVRHLLHCAGRGTPVNREVYRFLDDNSDDPAIEKLGPTECLWLGHSYRSPDHVFWGDHPFGRYRWRLADELKGYGDLLENIGVTESPDHEDALDVLNEIAAEFGEANKPLHDEAHRVTMACWQMLEHALSDEIISVDWFSKLRNTKSIPNKSNVLSYPTWLFFENRVGLADKFGDLLEKNVIPQKLGTGRAFLAAGVRQLGSAVQIELVRIEDQDDDPGTKERLRQRHGEIARVLFGQMASIEVQVALGRLSDLDCKSAISLELQYRLNAFEINRTSLPELASALYHPTEHSLWAVHSNGQVPLAPLARELAIALCPEEDPGLFAAGLKEVLAANTTGEAATVLDELGFPQLDATAVEPPPFQESAAQLGIETDLDHLETSRHDGRDGDHSDTASGDETETSTESESRGAEDRSSSQAREFVSYIAVSHDEDTGSDPDGTTHQERMSLEEKAIELIIGEEPALRRTPTNNPGFDLTELGSDGQPVRWVEVKAMKGTLLDRPVGLSRTQFDWAQEHGRSYWLYVVERAGNPGEARVVRIQDPAGKAQTFTFDHGWIAVAEDIDAVEPEIQGA